MKTMLLVAITLLALLIVSMSSASAQTPRPGADEPPLAGFTKTVSPTTAVAGEVVRYVIQFTTPISPAYTATVALSDTLDGRLAVIAASRAAQRSDGTPIGKFTDPPTGSQAVYWRAPIVPGDAVTITFDVTVTLSATATESLTNVAVLYAVGTPTATLTATAQLLLQPSTLHLPIGWRALEHFPALDNSDFELGPGHGWVASPPEVIDTYASIGDPTVGPPGGDPANRYLAWFGGRLNETHTLSQSVVVPGGYTSAGLRYKYWIASAERACDQDTASLTISTRAPAQPRVYPIRLCQETNTRLPGQADGWRDQQIDLSDLLAEAGSPAADKPLTIAFQAVLNGSLTSNLWIEDVVLCSDQAGAVGAAPCSESGGGR